MTTLLLAEHDNFSLKDATARALAAAALIGGDIHVLVAGKDCAAAADAVGSSRVDLQACKLEYSIVSPK